MFIILKVCRKTFWELIFFMIIGKNEKEKFDEVGLGLKGLMTEIGSYERNFMMMSRFWWLWAEVCSYG